MAFKIIWTNEAKSQFKEVVAYLENYWTQKEVANFVNGTFENLDMISINPMLARRSFSETTREILITKHNLLIFKIDNNHKQIFILSVGDTRQHPGTKFSFKL
jgi:plasmid stabilization system protein ParE